MSDIFQEVQAELDAAQATWGRDPERHGPLRKVMTGIRALAVRIKQLEDRVTALEQRLPPPS